jgi:hypothetical protein
LFTGWRQELVDCRKFAPSARNYIAAKLMSQVGLNGCASTDELEEALIHGPDPLHLAVVFGLDDKTAIRYASSARQLLETEIECDTSG